MVAVVKAALRREAAPNCPARRSSSPRTSRSTSRRTRRAGRRGPSTSRRRSGACSPNLRATAEGASCRTNNCCAPWGPQYGRESNYLRLLRQLRRRSNPNRPLPALDRHRTRHRLRAALTRRAGSSVRCRQRVMSVARDGRRSARACTCCVRARRRRAPRRVVGRGGRRQRAVRRRSRAVAFERETESRTRWASRTSSALADLGGGVEGREPSGCERTCPIGTARASRRRTRGPPQRETP